jgi:hypothetical protein
MSPLAAEYRAAIEGSGLTQEEVAGLAGLTRKCVCEFLAGKDAKLSTLSSLAGALGRELALVRPEALPTPPRALGDRELVKGIVDRAHQQGERFVQTRLARLIGRHSSAITRALAGGSLSPEARRRLLDHWADPGSHPLPPAGGRKKKTIARRQALARR